MVSQSAASRIKVKRLPKRKSILIFTVFILLFALILFFYLRFLNSNPSPLTDRSTVVKEAQTVIEEKLGTIYNNWPIELEQNNYHLWCVAVEDMVRHEPFIQLPDGSIITHSIPCQYFDSKGQEQIIYIPAVRFKEDERLTQVLGYTPVANNPTYDDLWSQMSNGLAMDIGPINLLNNHGYTGIGQIMLITFGLVKDSPVTRFAHEAEQQLYSHEILSQFAQVGDPDLLYNKLIFPQGVPFYNQLSELQKSIK
jgi:hypothetical protein